MLKRLLQTEPTRVIGHSITLVLAIIDVVVAFGVAVSPEQSDAITGALQSILLMATLLVGAGTEAIRSNVFSPDSAKKLVAETRKKTLIEARELNRR